MSEQFRGHTSNNFYLIEKELGSGGQGRVYLVRDLKKGTHYAAKWYREAPKIQDQYKQIQELVQRGSPKINDAGIFFIWPIEMLSFLGSQGFGYLMPLIDTNRFHSLNRICSGRVKQPSPTVLCRISRRVAAALDILHAAGLAYCDINLGNIMLDPLTGEIVVCDNDNVVVNNSESPVKGVWEFMAPEVALNKVHPNAESDLYSLAVLLYYLWMWEHPMEGKQTLNLYSWDIPAKKKFFAENPVFVFHPTNPINNTRGVTELQLHEQRWQRLCPSKLKIMFTETFVEAVHDPSRRKRLYDWQRLFLEMEANAPTCGCGAVNLWDGASRTLTCWKCRRDLPLGLVLRVRQGTAGDCWLLAYPGAQLRRHHFDLSRFSDNSIEALGRIESHPREVGHVILRNLTNMDWGYVIPGGEIIDIKPGQARALMPGIQLNIGQRTVEVQTLVAGGINSNPLY